MKKLIIIFLVLTLYLPEISVAQIESDTNIQAEEQSIHLSADVKRCGAMEHLQWRKSQDAGLEKRMQKIESDMQFWLLNHSEQKRQMVLTIPIVVHVVYKTASQNISDAQIKSQIDVLNEDYNRVNADTTNTPSVWKNIASGVNVQFCLASRTPDGYPTNGIIRKQTSVSLFSSTNDAVKHSSQGGDDAWPASDYMNIWVCNLGSGILGYGEFPGGDPSIDGVVVLFKNFGRMGVVVPPYHKGRTTTHEFSHCFNLYHIWGDDNGACTGTDYCADTPNQANASQGCPTFPLTDSCTTSSPGVMFMNYMDYSVDTCVNMFTQNQIQRIIACLNSLRSSRFAFGTTI